jgi:undecaprenyl pyrophosphate synthase
MKILGLTEQEAREMLEADRKIDKGEKLFELSAEQEKNAKKARSTGTKKPTVYNFDTTKKKRKECPDKQHLMNLLAEALGAECQKIEVTNKERELTFEFNGTGYRLTLAVPRVKSSE